MASLQNKRKRDAFDMASGRSAPGMAQTNDQFEQHYLQTDDGMDDTDGVMDFAAALAQHGADPNDGSHQMDGDGTGQSASDTAAAAMAQYHTMTVPQSTEQSFMTHNDGDKQPGMPDLSIVNGQPRHSSFPDFNASAIESSPNGDTSPTGAGNGSGPKPPVGSDEWHKVRKDNHKEGKTLPPLQRPPPVH